jgi:hypothetical protein
VRLSEDDAVRLKIAEEEELILENRKAESRSELVLTILRDWGRALEELADVKGVVANVLPQAAVEVVGA